MDLLELIGKAQIEHAIGFIEDQQLQTIDKQAALLEVIGNPPRRANDDLRDALQLLGLIIEILAAEDQGPLEIGATEQQAQLTIDLFGQFAGRRQDQRTRPSFAEHLAGQQPLNHGKQEGERLAGTCF